MAGLSTLQSGPKGSERDQNGQPKCFWPLGTLLGPSGPFWTVSNKNWYFAPKHLCKTLYCPFGAKISSPALTLVCDCVGRCSWLWFSQVKLARLPTSLALICQMGKHFLPSPVRWFHYVTVDFLLKAPNSGQQYWSMAPLHLNIPRGTTDPWVGWSCWTTFSRVMSQKLTKSRLISNYSTSTMVTPNINLFIQIFDD